MSVFVNKDGPEGTEPQSLMVEVIIEIPRGSFLKRGSTGHIDFVSPLPCPYNYGSVPDLIGLEGDLLDALILGPRIPCGQKVRVPAWGAVGLADRGMYDDKLVCSLSPITESQRASILRFFSLYARCKRVLNWYRGQPGRTACEGWGSAEDAIGRARPRDESWHGSPVPF